MRAVEILRTNLERNLRGIHRRRRDSLWRAVVALVLGGKLCLTGLGRSLPGETSDKHRIKAVDRLLGNEHLHSELEQVQRAIALWLLKGVRTPVIAVDWTGAGLTITRSAPSSASIARAITTLFNAIRRNAAFSAIE